MAPKNKRFRISGPVNGRSLSFDGNYCANYRREATIKRQIGMKGSHRREIHWQQRLPTSSEFETMQLELFICHVNESTARIV